MCAFSITDAFGEIQRIPLDDGQTYYPSLNETYSNVSYFLPLGIGYNNIILEWDDTLNSQGIFTNEYSSVVPMVLHLKFNLTNIPDSDLFQKVTINSAKLSFMVHDNSIQYGGKAPNSSFFIETAYCFDNITTPSEFVRYTYACGNQDEIEGAVLTDIQPFSVQTFDVTDAISEAISRNKHHITFSMTATPENYIIDSGHYLHAQPFEFLSIYDIIDSLKLYNYCHDTLDCSTEILKENIPPSLQKWLRLENETLYHDIVQISITSNEAMREHIQNPNRTLDGDVPKITYRLNYTVSDESLSFMVILPTELKNHPSSNIAPKLEIDYTTSPTDFYNYLVLVTTVIVPTVASIVTGVFWVIKRAKNLEKRIDI